MPGAAEQHRAPRHAAARGRRHARLDRRQARRRPARVAWLQELGSREVVAAVSSAGLEVGGGGDQVPQGGLALRALVAARCCRWRGGDGRGRGVQQHLAAVVAQRRVAPVGQRRGRAPAAGSRSRCRCRCSAARRPRPRRRPGASGRRASRCRARRCRSSRRRSAGRRAAGRRRPPTTAATSSSTPRERARSRPALKTTGGLTIGGPVCSAGWRRIASSTARIDQSLST